MFWPESTQSLKVRVDKRLKSFIDKHKIVILDCLICRYLKKINIFCETLEQANNGQLHKKLTFCDVRD